MIIVDLKLQTDKQTTPTPLLLFFSFFFFLNFACLVFVVVRLLVCLGCCLVVGFFVFVWLAWQLDYNPENSDVAVLQGTYEVLWFSSETGRQEIKGTS